MEFQITCIIRSQCPGYCKRWRNVALSFRLRPRVTTAVARHKCLSLCVECKRWAYTQFYSHLSWWCHRIIGTNLHNQPIARHFEVRIFECYLTNRDSVSQQALARQRNVDAIVLKYSIHLQLALLVSLVKQNSRGYAKEANNQQNNTSWSSQWREQFILWAWLSEACVKISRHVLGKTNKGKAPFVYPTSSTGDTGLISVWCLDLFAL
jgi:hypothetical protein